MTQSVTEQINSELEGMSPEQLKQALIQHLAKANARKESYNTPAAKARRKAYYEEKKNTPEWKAARKVQAEARKVREQALIAMAKRTFSAEQLAELGIS